MLATSEAFDYKDVFFKLENTNVVPSHAFEFVETFDPHAFLKVTRVGDALVTTKFLGVAQGFNSHGEPIIFETQIIGGKYDARQARCCTYKHALDQHDHIVRFVQRTWHRVLKGLGEFLTVLLTGNKPL